MPSTFSDLKIQLMKTGENNTTWGDISNVNWEAVEAAIGESSVVNMGAGDLTLPWIDTNTSQSARYYLLWLSSDATVITRTLTVPQFQKSYSISNGTAGPVTVRSTAGGAAVTVPPGMRTLLYVAGPNVYDLFSYISNLTLGTPLPITSGGTGSNSTAGAGASLGLKTMAYQDASAVAITGGTVAGITDLAVADGGTGASTADTARANLVAAKSGANSDIQSLNYGSGVQVGAPVGGFKGFATLNAQALYDNGNRVGLGSVTYVDATGGGTGLTLTGGPITTSGWFTLGGILNVASGGTGQNSLGGIQGALGLGSMAYQNANGVGISGGNIYNVGLDTTAAIYTGGLYTKTNGHVSIGRGGQFQIASADGGNTAIIYNAASDLRFWNQGDRMMIASNGLVGVGMVPGTNFDVAGQIRASGSFHGDVAGLYGSCPSVSAGYATNAGNAYGCSGNSNTATTASNSNALGGQGPGFYMTRQTNVWQNSDDGYQRFLWQPASNSYYKSPAGHIFRNNGDVDTFTIDVSGNTYCVGNSGAFSDAKLKTNLVPISNALDKVCELVGYTYDRVDRPESGRQVGLIAQEVREVLPEAVGSQGDTLTLAYGNMVALLVEAIKELREEVVALKASAA